MSFEARELSAKQQIAAMLIRLGRTAGRKTGLGGTKTSRGLSKLLYSLALPHGAPMPLLTYRGIRLTVPEGDRAALPDLLASRFEELELSLFERIAGASRTIFDVGANIGIYSCIGAERLPRDGSVTSFEPVPENVAALRRNLELNSCSEKVRVIESAVGSTDGQLDLFLTEGNSFAHSAAEGRFNHKSTAVSVSMLSIDSYLTRTGGSDPDIVKIDVEGYEPLVLLGAERLIKRSHPTIFIEYLPDNMRACGGNPAVLRDIIFDSYRCVFAIDDVCGRLAPVDKMTLAQFECRNSHCVNLLAVSRAEHLTLLPERDAPPWNCIR